MAENIQKEVSKEGKVEAEPKLAVVEFSVDPEKTLTRTKEEALASVPAFDHKKKLDEALHEGDDVLFTSLNHRLLLIWIVEAFSFFFPIFLLTAIISQLSAFLLPPDIEGFDQFLDFQNVAVGTFFAAFAVLVATLLALFLTPRTSTLCVTAERLIVVNKFVSRRMSSSSFPRFTWKSIRITFHATGQFPESTDAEKVAKETISSATEGKVIWLSKPPSELQSTVISKIDHCETLVTVLSKLIKATPQYSFFSVGKYYLILSLTSGSIFLFASLLVVWFTLTLNYFYLVITAPLLLAILGVVFYCLIQTIRHWRVVSVEVKFIPK